MEIDYSKEFIKKSQRAPQKIRQAIKIRIAEFAFSPFSPRLNNHGLAGKWQGYRSINITGDWRAIFAEGNDYDSVKFVAVGTHSQLYH